jgi:hypothetical protein
MHSNHPPPDGLVFYFRAVFGIEVKYPVSLRQASPTVREGRGGGDVRQSKLQEAARGSRLLPAGTTSP